MKKSLILVLVCLAAISSFNVQPVFADDKTLINSDQPTEIQPKKDILKWIHTTINGKKYKRLWNASKGVWMTNWILEQ